MSAPRAVRAAALAGAVITGALAGCASGPRVVPVPPALLADRPLVVMLPLSNLTGRNEQGDMVSKVFFAELARTGAFELVDAGEVERLTQAMRMRDLGSPTAGQVRALRDSTGARLVLAGSLLEAGTVRAPEGDIPTIGAALRLIDAETQRAVWADSRFLTGQDRETVFGWGRETSLSRLTSRLAREMFQTFRVREAARDTAKGGVR